MATLPDGREMHDPCALVGIMSATLSDDVLQRHLSTLRSISRNMGNHAVEEYVRTVKANSGQRAAVQLWNAYSKGVNV